MRIAIMGAGAVGAYFGAKLAAATNEVSFIARGAHVWLIGAQLVSFIGYLIYIARHFKAIAPLIQRCHYTNQEASLSNTR